MAIRTQHREVALPIIVRISIDVFDLNGHWLTLPFCDSAAIATIPKKAGANQPQLQLVPGRMGTEYKISN